MHQYTDRGNTPVTTVDFDPGPPMLFHQTFPVRSGTFCPQQTGGGTFRYRTIC